MNKPVRRILLLAAPTAVLGYVIFALCHSYYVGSRVLCKSIEFTNTQNTTESFISKDDITAAFAKNGLYYMGKKLVDIPIREMQKVVADNSFVKHANVYTDINGVLHIDVEQRVPMLRVFPSVGGSFYIDEEEYVFGATRHCYVPVVSGRVDLLHSGFRGSISDLFKQNKSTDSTLLLLCEFGRYIQGHPFWSAQIEQIYFVSPVNVELIPRVGAHVIKMGSLSGYQQKLHKLMLLYRQGLPARGWNTYRIIDLSVAGQVVCTRR
jgi:cell division protein FtsQ